MGFVSTILAKIRGYMFPQAAVEQAFQVKPAVSQTMEQNIGLWYAMYINEPPWADDRVRPLGLPAAIARELARPTLVELNVDITGGQRADYIADVFHHAQRHMLKNLEMGLALGGIAFKPYLDGDKLAVDATGTTGFQPTEFDQDGHCTGGVFKSEPVEVDGRYYIKLESHGFEGDVYVIRNKAYDSDSTGSVKNPVPLATVPEWAELEDETRIDGLKGPLFAYFRVPNANNIDTASDVGVSVYGGAVAELIKQADEQWALLRWEYVSGKRKIYMDGTQVLAEKFDRELFEVTAFSKEGLFEVFSPAFRDSPIYDGLQNILKQIEFGVGMAYGTISDPASVEKTATEIRNSKQRMFVTIDSIQREMECVFDMLLYAINAYASLYKLAPKGDYEVAYDWGDSVLSDAETKQAELQDMREDVAAGLIRPELYVARKYGVTEEEARAMMPGMEDVVTEPEEEIE